MTRDDLEFAEHVGWKCAVEGLFISDLLVTIEHGEIIDMKCLHCPTGQTVPGTKVAAIERGDTLLVVRHVPANVCDTWGSGYYSADTVDRLTTLLNAAVAAGADVLIKEFSSSEAEHGQEESTHSHVEATRR